MEACYYPKNLADLELTFAETIYTIVFHLDDEIRTKGKAEVFAELNLTTEDMTMSVKKLLVNLQGGHHYHYGIGYALLRVMGDLNLRDLDFRGLNGPFCDQRDITNLGEAFKLAYNDLYYAGRNYSGENIKFNLLDGVLSWTRPNPPIQEGQDLPGSVVLGGVEWPYRSAKVLQSLGLVEIGKITEYFNDFGNFINGNTVTLLEWAVITRILRNKGLLPGGKSRDGVHLNTTFDETGLSVEAGFCTKMFTGICDVQKLMMNFANGARRGWENFSELKEKGQELFEEVVDEISKWEFDLEDDMCYLSDESPITALDFNKDCVRWFDGYRIQTIGQLRVACKGQGRFTSLYAIDRELYAVAIEHLEKYGFQ